MSLSFYEAPNTEQPDPVDEVMLDEQLEEPAVKLLDDSAEYKVAAVTPLYPSESGPLVVPSTEDFRISHSDSLALFTAINPVRRAGAFISAVGNQARRNKAIRGRGSTETTQKSIREPEQVYLPYKGHEHLFVVTHPLTGETDTKIAWFKPGLSETADAGSAKRLHMEFARQNPELLVITEATKGISHSGKTASLYDLAGRNLETMAIESLHFIRHFSNDGERETELYGTSLGTVSEANMLAINIAANPKDQQNIKTAFLIASAIIACEVDKSEDFRDTDLGEEDYRKWMKERFRNHIVPDLLNMAVNNPGDIIASKDNVGTFLFAPEKAWPRLLAIRKDYKDVGKGVSWAMIKEIVQSADLKILGGAEDPLIQEQIPQWDKINEIFKREDDPDRDRVVHRTVRKYGHLISGDVVRTISELEKLRTQTKSSIV